MHIINRNAFKKIMCRADLFQKYTTFPHSSANITPQQSLQLRGATRALRQREHTHTRTKAQHRPAATSGDHGADGGSHERVIGVEKETEEEEENRGVGGGGG